jgi:PAS domain S-box-containing protein
MFPSRLRPTRSASGQAAAPASPDYARFRLRLVSGLLTVACLCVVAVCWKIDSTLADRENAAHIQSQSYAQAFVAHVSDAILLVDYALDGFAQAVALLPPEQAQSSSVIRQLLSSHDPASSDAFRVKFIDLQGLAMDESGNPALLGVSFAKLDFFRAHAENSEDIGLFVGQPVIARVSRLNIFTLSRRVLDAQGKFIGVIVAPIDAGRFAAIFELARLNKDISITLVHRGGKIIARAPQFAQTFATDIKDSDLFRRSHGQQSDTLETISPFDARPMIYGYRHFQHGALEVIVGISTQAMHQAMRKDAWIGAAGLALMAAIMLLMARFALRSYRRLELSSLALQESEFRWKFALEGAGDGVWDWNLATDDVVFSMRCKNMLGYAEHEMGNTCDAWKQLLHPQDSVRVLAELDAYLAGLAPLYISEYRLRCNNGSWKWVLGRGTVLARDASGGALRMIGTHADITGRKQAEHVQLQKIIEAASDPMLLVDNDGIISLSNLAAQTTFAYTAQELIGLNMDQLVPSSTRGIDLHLHRPFERIAQRLYLKTQLSALRKDGTAFSVEIGLTPFKLADLPVVIVSLRDVSERETKTQLLLQSFAQLRRLADHQETIKEIERKRIAQDIHDDLGQNLLALKMDVATLHARTAHAHPRLHGRTELVMDTIDATIKSVKSIMNDLRPATLTLGLGPAAEWQLKQFARSSGIACTLEASSLDSDFGLDEGRSSAIFRILQESLANVARHAEASRITIALKQDQFGFSMKVKDNGKGLQPGDRRKSNSFGLMGIKERIDALGGELVITSSPGKGTVLSIFVAQSASN